MTERSTFSLTAGLVVLAATIAFAFPAQAQTPKRGGVLNAMLSEDPPGFSIHEAEVVYWGLCPACSTARSS